MKTYLKDDLSLQTCLTLFVWRKRIPNQSRISVENLRFRGKDLIPDFSFSRHLDLVSF